MSAILRPWPVRLFCLSVVKLFGSLIGVNFGPGWAAAWLVPYQATFALLLR